MMSEVVFTAFSALVTILGSPEIELLQNPSKGLFFIVLIMLLGRLTVFPTLHIQEYKNSKQSNSWFDLVLKNAIGVVGNTILFYILCIGFGAPLLLYVVFACYG
ncbi:hypothetical protein RTP6_002543 [Batrachochytrium dendrobatidis]